MAEASRKAGLGDTTIRDVFKRDRDPSIETFLKIADALGVPAAYLLEGDKRYIPKIPFIGYASAGEGWCPVEDLSDTLEARIIDKDPIAIGIQGNSMAPVYRDGDVLICSKIDGANISNWIGHDCAVYTEDGDSYIKILKRGTEHGLYTLRSYNHVAYPDIEDVLLKWAAPIMWVKRNNL